VGFGVGMADFPGVDRALRAIWLTSDADEWSLITC
jgi:hypothetical protein